MSQAELMGMPEPAVLRLVACAGQTLVHCGRAVLYRYDSDDTGMRNLAIVALTDAGRRVEEVAGVFGLSPTYVSILRGRARVHGSAGLVRRRGRPPKLTARQVAKARVWAGEGSSQQSIADRLGVARSVISELLARLGPAPVQPVLPEPGDVEPGDVEPGDVEPGDVEAGGGPAAQEQAAQAEESATGAEGAGAAPPLIAGSAQIGVSVHRCRYAGATLLFPYLHRVGAEAVFATLTGGPARRYDDVACGNPILL